MVFGRGDRLGAWSGKLPDFPPRGVRPAARASTVQQAASGLLVGRALGQAGRARGLARAYRPPQATPANEVPGLLALLQVLGQERRQWGLRVQEKSDDECKDEAQCPHWP